jgi:hypothetical protein
MFFLLRQMAGFCRKVSLVLGEKLAGCGGCLRPLLAGLDRKQLSTATLDGGECWQGAGRVEGVMSERHVMELSRFDLEEVVREFVLPISRSARKDL